MRVAGDSLIVQLLSEQRKIHQIVKYPPEIPFVSPAKVGGLIKKEERIMQRGTTGVDE